MQFRRTLAMAILAMAILAAAGLAGGPAWAVAPVLDWSDRHDGGGQFNDDGWCVVTDAAGHVVVAGESADGVGGIDLCVRKLDRDDGHRIWQVRYEGYDAKDVAVSDITWDTAGQLLVAGYIRGCVG